MNSQPPLSGDDPGPNPAWGKPENLHPIQVEGLRRMSPARKFELLIQMYHTAVSLKVAGLRIEHPDWTDAQLQREARRLAMYART